MAAPGPIRTHGRRGQDWLLHLDASGKLGVQPVWTTGTRRIDVNLDKPVPTVGSSIKNPDIIPGFLAAGACDQVERPDVHLSPGTGLPLSSRHDVAVFRSEPLTEAVEITGPITISLWLSSEAPACDLSVKIVDEYPSSGDWPNGFAMNIAENHQRFASWTSVLPDDEADRAGSTSARCICRTGQAGHRIELQIANTNWRGDIKSDHAPPLSSGAVARPPPRSAARACSSSRRPASRCGRQPVQV